MGYEFFVGLHLLFDSDFKIKLCGHNVKASYPCISFGKIAYCAEANLSGEMLYGDAILVKIIFYILNG